MNAEKLARRQCREELTTINQRLIDFINPVIPSEAASFDRLHIPGLAQPRPSIYTPRSPSKWPDVP